MNWNRNILKILNNCTLKCNKKHKEILHITSIMTEKDEQ